MKWAYCPCCWTQTHHYKKNEDELYVYYECENECSHLLPLKKRKTKTPKHKYK